VEFGVEEQFYVLFPIFLMLAWRLGRKRIVVLLTIVALLSLALAEYAVSRKPVATFFLLPTRGWELAMGSLIAYYLKGKEQDHFPRALYQILSFAGLGLIAYSLLAFTKETLFPGLSALIPTVGAGLIIIFALPGTLVRRLLVSRVLVGVGLVSYSAYLWHQPLLSFARHRSFTEPNDEVMAFIIVLTFGLAYLTWRYVEQPFRQRNTITRRAVWRFSLASAAVLSLCAVGLQATTVESHSRLNRDGDALSRLHTCLFNPGQTFATLVQNHCDSVLPSAIQSGGGRDRTSKVYVLFGDSVAAHLYPGLVRAFGENAIIQLTGTSCRAIRSGSDSRRCTDFYDWFVDEYVPNNHMDGIIVSSSWLKTYEKLGDKEFRVKLDALFEKLEEKRVIVYSQPAALSMDIHRYVYKLESFGMEVPNNLEVRAHGLDAVNAALSEEASKFGFEFIDASQLFCLKDKCTVAKDGIFYFWDAIHLTMPGSALLAEVTYSLLSGIYPEQTPGQDRLKKDGIPSIDAIMVRNLDGTIRYWSEGAKKLYGWEPHDALGTTSHQLLKTIFPVPLEVIEEELRTKGRWEGKLIHMRRDGSEVTVVSHWDFQQNSRSQDGSATVIEINGPLPIPSSGSFRKEVLSFLHQSECSNSPPLCQKIF